MRCEMKENQEMKKRINKITASEDTGALKRFFSKDHAAFESMLQKWFQPSRESKAYDPPSPADYLEEIVRYVDLVIQMYQKAVFHHTLKDIKLFFSETWNGCIEPKIHLEFDTGCFDISIDELWNSELKLDRGMKEECVCASGDVWGEYRPTIDADQLRRDAADICVQLQLRYPDAAVSYSVC